MTFVAPAMAQETPTPAPTTSTTTPPTTTSDDQTASAGNEIVITGTLFKGANDTPSPVTTITTENLDKRGVSTIQDALQTLASNNGPALTNSFTANGAFAGGASAVSLRGLSTNSTLVLFDGLRAAYYPLADDGSRNFVDLNTIPDDIVDRIEVLRDGASSTYGADAIAGVVNIITKRSVKGLMGRAEGGISERGDAGQYRLTLTAGVGDLDEQGFNAYISGFYYKQNILYNRDRGFPYNTDDHRTLCYQGNCGPNTVVNGTQADGLLHGQSTAGSFEVRPYDATNTTAQGNWQLLNPNCGPGSLYTLTAADRAYRDANGNAINATAPNQICQVDYTNAYGVISPNVERFGVSGRVTAKISNTIEAYAEVNFLQSQVSYTGSPATVYGTANTGIDYPRFSTSSATVPPNAVGSFILNLPVYVCPERVNCATSPNRTLNPNNPFAAQGQVARLIGRDLSQVTSNMTRNKAYRIALGFKGDLFEGWTFNVDATAMHDDLLRRTDGYVYIQHLLDVIADGSYNFKNPSATPQSVLDYLTPVNNATATSDQYQLQASVAGKLAELPGGNLQLGFGGSIRYEAVNAPSGNPDYNGPTQRFFTLNAFGTVGHRYITSGFAELDAPILDILDINASGRYDRYSSGQDAFSPKIGFKLKPVRQLTLRGTYSKGFRIPSFGEANALPTTGYVTNNSSLFNDAYLAQYGCTVATFNNCPTYIRSGSYGQTTLASPNLKPEKSRSFTGGIKLNPVKNVEITVDYYNIKKTGAITAPSNSPALLAYYEGQPIPAGYNVVADAPDPNFPLAKPRVAFVQAQLINANTVKAEGLDFSADANFDFGAVRWSTSADASVILNLSTEFPDGHTERYDGTLGNFNLTAGSGTPKWHGSWQNSLDFGKISVTGTANYFGGYDLSATDQGTGYKDCGLSDGSVPCRVKALITFDLNAQFKPTDKFTFYINAINLFDKMPPIDPVTYGANYYNPVQGGTAIYGRMFKAGAKFAF
ncbi:MAG: TonB-dependent receptor domain-containing protein [Sphingomonas sp.]|uniref:TonB-dependent receptor domain-containing protein n=1 Tax=Sphingomonas sp. TaxID=28214 RepID=UPI003F7FC978